MGSYIIFAVVVMALACSKYTPQIDSFCCIDESVKEKIGMKTNYGKVDTAFQRIEPRASAPV